MQIVIIACNRTFKRKTEIYICGIRNHAIEFCRGRILSLIILDMFRTIYIYIYTEISIFMLGRHAIGVDNREISHFQAVGNRTLTGMCVSRQRFQCFCPFCALEVNSNYVPTYLLSQSLFVI